MKCRDCKYMKPVDENLYKCTNKKSKNYMRYTGNYCEDDCKDGERKNNNSKGESL